jgi:hypothetical protein
MAASCGSCNHAQALLEEFRRKDLDLMVSGRPIAQVAADLSEGLSQRADNTAQ